ncbi:MAG TPA: hypothetical protein VE011_09800 [Candidatus Dormibacteraeota bacterium]|nr:hypothetical protein [Candidatus Dormibacteraeota bacterium]
MAQSMGWSGRHDAAREEVWGALERLGITRWGLATAKPNDPPPTQLLTLARELARTVVEPAELVLDELGADLDIDACKRIMAAAATSALYGVASGLAGAIANELATPDALPFAPPQAGLWIRSRYVPRPGQRRSSRRTSPLAEPRWDGGWHIFSGDWSEVDRRTHWIRGRMKCGWSATLRDENFSTGETSHDYVAIDELPTVDACRRCHPRPRLRLVAGGVS